MNSRSRKTINPRIPCNAGTGVSGFYRPGRYCLRPGRGPNGPRKQSWGCMLLIHGAKKFLLGDFHRGLPAPGARCHAVRRYAVRRHAVRRYAVRSHAVRRHADRRHALRCRAVGCHAVRCHAACDATSWPVRAHLTNLIQVEGAIDPTRRHQRIINTQ